MLRFLKRRLLIFWGYWTYRKLICEKRVRIIAGKTLLRTNQLLIFEYGKNILHRCSLSKNGSSNIVNNHKYLKENLDPGIPAAFYLWQDKALVMTGESLLQGEKISAGQLGDKYLPEIMKVLNYQQNAVASEFNLRREMAAYEQMLGSYPRVWVERVREMKETILRTIKAFGLVEENKRSLKTLIHGDLTFRNILMDKETLRICDFCRAGRGYPEFDLYLLSIDQATYCQETVSFVSFFRNIVAGTKSNSVMSLIKRFYELQPDFALNLEIERTLRYLFLYRMLVLTLECFQEHHAYGLKTLREIEMEFAKL